MGGYYCAIVWRRTIIRLTSLKYFYKIISHLLTCRPVGRVFTCSHTILPSCIILYSSTGSLIREQPTANSAQRNRKTLRRLSDSLVAPSN